jgi:hypothetical protein
MHFVRRATEVLSMRERDPGLGPGTCTDAPALVDVTRTIAQLRTCGVCGRLAQIALTSAQVVPRHQRGGQKMSEPSCRASRGVATPARAKHPAASNRVTVGPLMVTINLACSPASRANPSSKRLVRRWPFPMMLAVCPPSLRCIVGITELYNAGLRY